MAKVRTLFAHEVEQLLPLLHQTYRCIGQYQKSGGERHKEELWQQLELAGTELQFYKEWMQPAKQPYFASLLDTSLSLSDRIIALDTAVGMMHIEFAAERAYSHRETAALRRALDESRRAETSTSLASGLAEDQALVRGLGASPGVASGKVYIVRRGADYRRVPARAVVVAQMTRPELIMTIERVAAIVTDAGGSLCHAAIVARERGVPCVVGTQNATTVLRPRLLVRVDGSAGVVQRLR